MPTAFEAQYPQRDAHGRSLAAPQDGRALLSDAGQSRAWLDGGDPVHRQHSAVKGGASPASLRRGADLLERRGRGMDGEDQDERARRATSCFCRASSCTPCSAPRPAGSTSSASSIRATIRRSTTSLCETPMPAHAQTLSALAEAIVGGGIRVVDLTVPLEAGRRPSGCRRSSRRPSPSRSRRSRATTRAARPGTGTTSPAASTPARTSMRRFTG